MRYYNTAEEQRKMTQEKLDQIYQRYEKLYHDEMAKFMKTLSNTPKSKKAA